MAHFAKLDSNNIVIAVVVGRDEDENAEDEISVRTGDVYKRTSYNTLAGKHNLSGTPFRKNYAGIGYTYDEARDAFIEPQRYPSWVLDEETCTWGAPVVHPHVGKEFTSNVEIDGVTTSVTSLGDGIEYRWNEDTTSWDVIPDSDK